MRKAASLAICLAIMVVHGACAFAEDSGYGRLPSEGPNGSFLQGASLDNNSESRLLEKDGHMKGKPRSLGRVVNPTDVLITAPNWTPDVAAKLYTSVSKLPDHIDTIHVIYYSSSDKKTARFLGYAILSPDRKVTRFIRYDGPDKFEENDASAWIKWLNDSLKTLKPDQPSKKQ